MTDDAGPGSTGSELPGYGDALDELQSILSTLESDTTDVDLLAERVQRADVLIRHCRSRLDDARFRVEQVVAALDPDDAGDPERDA